MPEYLAPAVYVEEVPSGNKSIEGASTSTAGVVGVTQRGSVNTPTLVTSYGEFNRVFGGYLDHRLFIGGLDSLPYAVEGFFANGGKRLYVSRIIGSNRTYSSVDLYGIPVSNQAATSLSQRAAKDEVVITIDDGTHISLDDTLLLEDDIRSEYVTASSDPIASGIRIFAHLRSAGTGGITSATVQTIASEDADLTADITGDMLAGGELSLSAIAEATLLQDHIIRISDTIDSTLTEYVTISGDTSATFNEDGLLYAHSQATTQVQRVSLTAGTATTLSADAVAGDFLLALTSTTDFADDGIVTIGSEIYVVRNLISSLSIATTPLLFNHASGVAISKQVELLRVHGKDPGQWGNSLVIKTRLSSMLETVVTEAVANGNTVIKLGAVFGLSTGSVLEFSRDNSVEATARVINVNRATNEVELESGIGVDLLIDDDVSSVEFTLIVERLENDKVVESEAFENLAMDVEHFRYAPKIVGSFDRASDTISKSGASELVRLSDLTRQDDGAEISTALVNRLTIPYETVIRAMEGGGDDLGSVDANTYIGTRSDDPALRTGIQSLENESAISIVAVPGQTDVSLQKALLGHCEKMRYRFAVVETPVASKLKDAQTHRQNFDTTYGAVYYPWLTVADRFGEKGDLLNIPPSGHVLGIFARSDIQRGVHKAPANEVVKGILGFEANLNKGAQDILNPGHVNCFRDFRTANRGLRLWGARTLSSDSEWKYVNVRRLFLFVEQSIDAGMQFAVFEPNTESLWETVKRSINNFLVTVWRSGALEGITQEEAFFVDVGLHTMTQADIDNGRLIVNVGIAPAKPAEFVIIRISQKTREASA